MENKNKSMLIEAIGCELGLATIFRSFGDMLLKKEIEKAKDFKGFLEAKLDEYREEYCIKRNLDWSKELFGGKIDNINGFKIFLNDVIKDCESDLTFQSTTSLMTLVEMTIGVYTKYSKQLLDESLTDAELEIISGVRFLPTGDSSLNLIIGVKENTNEGSSLLEFSKAQLAGDDKIKEAQTLKEYKSYVDSKLESIREESESSFANSLLWTGLAVAAGVGGYMAYKHFKGDSVGEYALTRSFDVADI